MSNNNASYSNTYNTTTNNKNYFLHEHKVNYTFNF